MGATEVAAEQHGAPAGFQFERDRRRSQDVAGRPEGGGDVLGEPGGPAVVGGAQGLEGDLGVGLRCRAGGPGCASRNPSGWRSSPLPPGGGRCRAARSRPGRRCPACRRPGRGSPVGPAGGGSPMWSTWAWVTATASMAAGSWGKSSQFRCRSSLSPWNRPQSTSTVERGVSTRNRLPVTVPAPPRKVSVGRSGRWCSARCGHDERELDGRHEARWFDGDERAADVVQDPFGGVAHDQTADPGAGDGAHDQEVDAVFGHQRGDDVGGVALDHVDLPRLVGDAGRVQRRRAAPLHGVACACSTMSSRSDGPDVHERRRAHGRLAVELPRVDHVQLAAVDPDHRRRQLEDGAIQLGLVGLGIDRGQDLLGAGPRRPDHPDRAGALAEQPPDRGVVLAVLVGGHDDQVVLVGDDVADDGQRRVADLDDASRHRSRRERPNAASFLSSSSRSAWISSSTKPGGWRTRWSIGGSGATPNSVSRPPFWPAIPAMRRRAAGLSRLPRGLNRMFLNRCMSRLSSRVLSRA